VVLAWLLLAGLAGFILMGFDKRRAGTRGRRVREMTFYELALVGGALGIVAGALVFHHKTSKAFFFGVVLILAVCWIALLNALQTPFGPPLG
jgi:uncharacterized membrane protein YsdA (DUF1294 family)